MAIKAKVANKVQTNKQGLVEGTITCVLEIDERIEIEKGKEIKYGAQFEFQIESLGSQKTITYRIWTRQTLNNEKYEKNDGTKDYNDLTRLMLQLQLIKESDLINLDNINLEIDACEGLQIQFELEPSKKNKTLKVPKLTSIKPLTIK